MFCIKICFFSAGADRSRAFIGVAGAKIFRLEPELKINLSGAGAEKKCFFSATLIFLSRYLYEEKKILKWTTGISGWAVLHSGGRSGVGCGQPRLWSAGFHGENEIKAVLYLDPDP